MAQLEDTRRDRAASPRAPAVLLVAGNGTLATHAIAAPRLVIGRAPDCDVAIQHASLSRRHAVVAIGPPLTVQDLGSTNGTRVARELRRGGEPIEIGLGDSFHIGPFSFVVLDERRAAATDASVRDQLAIDDPTPAGVPPVVREIAASDTSVLVLGETGVGKEVLAATLHALSKRSGPLQQINCAALAESLVEGELFGHEKGAFTGAAQAKPGLFEAARGGTVFLDEIGELPAAMQAKLLRAVESREVTRVGGVRPIAIDVRFVSATNRDLGAEVAAGTFRRDLYFRLDGITLHITPLRERRGRLVPLALELYAAARAKRGAPPSPLDRAVVAKLEAHEWPGNVRELKATIERAVLLAGSGAIQPKHVVIAQRHAPSAPPPAATPPPASDLTAAQVAERAAIVDALAACAGNQTQAAKRLGMSRSTLATKLALYKVPRPRGR